MKKVLVFLGIVSFFAGMLVYADLGNLTPVVRQKAISLYDEKYEPEFIQEINLDAAQVILINGAVFNHTGFGATIGFNGKRLNYSGGGNAGLIGPFLLDENGNLFVEYVEFQYLDSKDPSQSNWRLIKSKIVRVEELSWNFENLRENF